MWLSIFPPVILLGIIRHQALKAVLHSIRVWADRSAAPGWWWAELWLVDVGCEVLPL
jgi:hypothetical protein